MILINIMHSSEVVWDGKGRPDESKTVAAPLLTSLGSLNNYH